MSEKLISVLAPATTANLGPGFDCLGMALDIWNRLEVFQENTGILWKIPVFPNGVDML